MEQAAAKIESLRKTIQDFADGGTTVTLSQSPLSSDKDASSTGSLVVKDIRLLSDKEQENHNRLIDLLQKLKQRKHTIEIDWEMVNYIFFAKAFKVHTKMFSDFS